MGLGIADGMVWGFFDAYVPIYLTGKGWRDELWLLARSAGVPTVQRS